MSKYLLVLVPYRVRGSLRFPGKGVGPGFSLSCSGPLALHRSGVEQGTADFFLRGVLAFLVLELFGGSHKSLDVSATFGTFGSWVSLGSCLFAGCPSYFWHFCKLGPSWVLTFHGMSKLLFALLEVGSLLGPDFSWDVQATIGTFGKLGPSWVLTFRGMSKLLLALLEVWLQRGLEEPRGVYRSPEEP